MARDARACGDMRGLARNGIERRTGSHRHGKARRCKERYVEGYRGIMRDIEGLQMCATLCTGLQRHAHIGWPSNLFVFIFLVHVAFQKVLLL